jgi:hypothetical protein
MQAAEYRQGQAFFYGFSMGSVFRDGDRLFVEHCKVSEILRGDVVMFAAPGTELRIAHRVVAVGPDGIRTKGDANPGVDPWLLNGEDLIGRVAAFERKGRVRPVAGGLRGRLRALRNRLIRRADHHSSKVFHPVYRALSRNGVFRWWLPASLSPRVLTIRRDTGEEMQLLMGNRVIGRKKVGENGWQIRRPFRIFVDEQALP